MTRHARSAALAAGLVASLSIAACADNDPAEPADSGTATPVAESPSAAESEDPMAEGDITFTGVEYGFEGPTSIAAGKTSITLVNDGEEPHELALFPVEEGRGPQDILDLIEENPKLQGPPPPWVIGEPIGTFAKPGKTGEPVTGTLQAGTYLAVCFVSTEESDGKTHAELGMIEEITVG